MERKLGQGGVLVAVVDVWVGWEAGERGWGTSEGRKGVKTWWWWRTPKTRTLL
jgi:hypothetical protein